MQRALQEEMRLGVRLWRHPAKGRKLDKEHPNAPVTVFLTYAKITDAIKVRATQMNWTIIKIDTRAEITIVYYNGQFDPLRTNSLRPCGRYPYPTAASAERCIRRSSDSLIPRCTAHAIRARHVRAGG